MSRLTLVSFNVNSVRKRIESSQIEALIQSRQPDIIGLQETKVQDQDFPVEYFLKMGYHSYFFGQKTHYGVALLSRKPLTSVVKGFPWDDDQQQRRLISAKLQLEGGKFLHIINGYFPQGENRDHPVKFPAKEAFYDHLLRYLQENYSSQDYLAVMGDMNISPEDIDIGIGENNRKRWLQTGKCSFLPEERHMLAKIKSWGLVDSFRFHQPDNKATFSWFDYRSKGFDDNPKRGLRIDLVMLTNPVLKALVDAGIDYDIRAMKQPSDHAPVWATFDQRKI